MHFELVLYTLSVKSSYRLNQELPLDSATDFPDTVQLCMSPSGSWRIKTFAIDHDIHVHKIGGDASVHIDAFEMSTMNNYSEVISGKYRFSFTDCHDKAVVSQALLNAGLSPILEAKKLGIAFWKPDDVKYFSQSRPK